MNRVRRDVVLLVASLAVFAVCAVVVADGRVGPIERAAFDAVDGLPDWLYRPMLAFQYLGVLAMPLVVALGALDLVLDVARDHGGSRHGQAAPTGGDRAT